MTFLVTAPRLVGKSLTIAGRAVPTLAIIAYFSGWQYINEYFSTFGLNRSSVSFNDYTIFVYSFSVIAKVPQMVTEGNLELAKTIVAALGLPAGAYFFSILPRSLPRALLLKLSSWACVIIALFFVSQEAGRLDARAVLGTQARGVSVFFTDQLEKDLAASLGSHNAKVRVQEIVEASNNGAIALIWRSSSETVFLMFGTSGQLEKKPIEIIRLGNGYIAGLFAKPPST